ncbi:prepilin peptidase [Psychrobacter cryohalolentis]|uniref:Prepilin leader peptidase/N-methyltransferase n=1 Tax=Psychrobacter cryohalolentis (strain ATCC BAA-1226 / DSM 17306 / VKM B-2378 / K5) TaxID=335284 RepID=Q1QEQ2_PSYCK|nr:A24 family peptidase [Psychrobacter cryohalolentis]ABE73851.1 type 4 prepilin peptidase 1, Aspartic peptidase, MEROPS family A24A [Psychrobacter cryohalolentis K5]ASE26490.1 prepilin peptidase [Psychrobacter cryohalolentis]
MQFIQLLQENMTIALVVFGLLGLCVGSFLNVVIHRTPLIMVSAWRKECSQFMYEQADMPREHTMPLVNIVATDTPITLSKPASRCPHCAHKIKWYENIPLISWIVLRGRCSECKAAIGLRYPIVELVTALLSALVIYHFGVNMVGLSALVLVWTLIALTGIDFDTQLLPDRLTFPLAGLGLAVNSQGWFVPPTQSIWGLLLGFLSLWIVVKIFYLITKKHGMGQGDFKLLAVLGAWLGPMMLPLIILLSSLLGSIVGLILMKKQGESKPFAFGPYIAIAGIVALLYGSDIVNWYLGMYT